MGQTHYGMSNRCLTGLGAGKIGDQVDTLSTCHISWENLSIEESCCYEGVYFATRGIATRWSILFTSPVSGLFFVADPCMSCLIKNFKKKKSTAQIGSLCAFMCVMEKERPLPPPGRATNEPQSINCHCVSVRMPVVYVIMICLLGPYTVYSKCYDASDLNLCGRNVLGVLSHSHGSLTQLWPSELRRSTHHGGATHSHIVGLNYKPNAHDWCLSLLYSFFPGRSLTVKVKCPASESPG